MGQEDGRPAGRVGDLLFSGRGDHVIGLLLQGGAWWRRRLVPYEEVAVIGTAAVLLRRPVVLSAGEGKRLRRLRRSPVAVIGRRVLSAEGHDLGVVDDVCFEVADGVVTGYLISRGVIADVARGKAFLPLDRLRRARGGGGVLLLGSGEEASGGGAT